MRLLLRRSRFSIEAVLLRFRPNQHRTNTEPTPKQHRSNPYFTKNAVFEYLKLNYIWKHAAASEL